MSAFPIELPDTPTLYRTVWQRVAANTPLRQILATFGDNGNPALFLQRAPEEFGSYPYIIYDLVINSGNNEGDKVMAANATLTFNVYDLAPGAHSPARAMQINRALEFLFDRQRFDDDEYNACRAFLETSGLVDEPGERSEVVHAVSVFDVRCYKTYLGEQLTGTVTL